MQQILWAEILFKLIGGAILVVAPLTAIRLAGFDRPISGYWPRVLGAVLMGIAAGIWLGIQFPSVRGAIGPAGLIPVNLFAAGALAYHLILGNAAPSRRGKLIVGALTVVLLGFAFLEIAHI